MARTLACSCLQRLKLFADVSFRSRPVHPSSHCRNRFRWSSCACCCEVGRSALAIDAAVHTLVEFVPLLSRHLYQVTKYGSSTRLPRCKVCESTWPRSSSKEDEALRVLPIGSKLKTGVEQQRPSFDNMTLKENIFTLERLTMRVSTVYVGTSAERR